MIEPTVGRVVWFWRDGQLQKSQGGQPYAATVAYVHSNRLVNLSVVDQNGLHYNRTSVTLVQEGDKEPGCEFCEWMPYQKAQAKKT